MDVVEAVEFTDPFCSYAWGTEPKYRRLAWQYSERVRVRRVFCGILSDGWYHQFVLDGDLAAFRGAQQAYLAAVSELTGMPHPAPVHHVLEGSDEVCRLAKAAERQGPDVAGRVLRRLRESLLVHGRPADTLARGLEACAGVPGLDATALAADFADPETAAAYRADWEEARRPSEFVLNLPDKRAGRGAAQPQDGRMRYGLPCLVLTGSAGIATIAGWRDWSDWEVALDAVAPGILATARPLPAPPEAFAAWPSLAPAEFDFLCPGHDVPPDGVVEHRWPGGTFWLTREESSRGLFAAAEPGAAPV